MPTVENAIQDVVPENIIAIATTRNTIPIGRNALLPSLAPPRDSDIGCAQEQEQEQEQEKDRADGAVSSG